MDIKEAAYLVGILGGRPRIHRKPKSSYRGGGFFFDNWILSTGFWVDTGIWVDTDFWID